MSIDKFGSHIFGKDNKFSSEEHNLIKVVDLSAIRLYYNLVLPFMGIYNLSDGVYQLLQDKRVKYVFPIESATIIGAEYPKKYVFLKINGKKVIDPVGLKLKKGDVLSFHRPEGSHLEDFYGELLIKCPVEVTN